MPVGACSDLVNESCIDHEPDGCLRYNDAGISAVIDPSGRIVARLGLGIEGVLDASLPTALPPTVYAQLRDIPIVVIIAVALLLVIRRRLARRTA